MEMETLEQKLSRVDLKLLTAFHVLMEERSVTKAANRMCVTQSAMSKSLQRLRDLFEDPLFVPTPQGLIPTPRAIELSPPVAAALSQLAAAIFIAPFDPAQAGGEINIQIPDILSLTVIPNLCLRLLKLAPKLRLVTNNTTGDHLKLLAAGKSDFSIYVDQDYGDEFITFPLGPMVPLCWMRRGHPLSKLKSLSMRDILAYPIIMHSYHDLQLKSAEFDHGINRIRKFIRDYQLEKTPFFRTSQMLTALAVIFRSDALLLGVHTQLNFQDDAQGLIGKPVSEFAEITPLLTLIQHKRTDVSPLHRWLREQILQSWSSNNPSVTVGWRSE